jgi:hypothetical protein
METGKDFRENIYVSSMFSISKGDSNTSENGET